MAMRKGDDAFRDVVDAGLRTLVRVPQVLRDLREVVRAEERDALPVTLEARKLLLAQLKK